MDLNESKAGNMGVSGGKQRERKDDIIIASKLTLVNVTLGLRHTHPKHDQVGAQNSHRLEVDIYLEREVSRVGVLWCMVYGNMNCQKSSQATLFGM